MCLTFKTCTILHTPDEDSSILKGKIGIIHKKDADLKVIVFSDKLTRFKDIVTVLDILNGAGVRNLNIAARIREP